MGPFGSVGLCDCVGPFGHVGPCGYVSTSRLFGRVGSVSHLVFRLDAVAASYCTKEKRSIGWPKRSTGLDKWLIGSMSSVLRDLFQGLFKA